MMTIMMMMMMMIIALYGYLFIISSFKRKQVNYHLIGYSYGQPCEFQQI